MKKTILIIAIMLPTLITFSQSIDGDNLFDDSYVHEIYLNFQDPNFLTTMYDLYTAAHAIGENPDYIMSAIAIDGNNLTALGNTLDTVGVRMKGDMSYALTENDKKPLKIDINEFVSGQKYDGLKKFNLAPAAGDPSFLREKIGYELHRSLGIPAPRCAYAKVFLNNEYWGLYQIIEQVDKTFLKDRFGNKDGNLFKSNGGASLQWVDDNQSTYEDVQYPSYKLKTNKTENDWSDLIAFMKLIDNTSDANFKTVIEANFNVSAFLKDMAVQNYIMNNDNYYHGGNNFYVYHNTETEKWEWIPWDLNYSMTNYFGETMTTPQSVPAIESSMLSSYSILSRRIMENEEFKNQYYNEVCQLVYGLGSVGDIHLRIDELSDMIRDDVLADTRKKYTNQNFEDNIAYIGVEENSIGNMYGVKDFTDKRANKLSGELMDLGITECINTSSVWPIFEKSGYILLSPNPVAHALNIEINGMAESNFYEIQIISMLGQEIIKINVEREETINTQSIRVEELISGIYFLTLKTIDGQVFTEKFIKQ